MVKHTYADSDDEFPIEWVTPAPKLTQPAQPSPSPYHSTSSAAGLLYTSGSGFSNSTATNAGNNTSAAAGSSFSKPVVDLTDSPPPKPKAKRQRKTKDVEPPTPAHKPTQTPAPFPGPTMSYPNPSIWDYPPPASIQARVPAPAPAPTPVQASTPTQKALPKTPAKPRQRKVKDADDGAGMPSSQIKGKGKDVNTPSGTQRKAAKEKPEKREARFKPSCPQAIRDRVERVMTQR